ncbi:MAG: thioesterase [Acidimicrobiales bacterium]|nr:thioesterase [Acidimicrobiales bacterium]
MATRVPADDELVPRPPLGRVFEQARRVRLGDVSPGGRLRLDAATRYLQDVSADDTADAALPDAESWVVRRTVLEVHSFPRYLEPVSVATWCSGTGSHYAERRVQVLGDSGGHVEGSSLWVHVDMATGRPKRLGEGFHGLYGEAAGGRAVKARRVHGDASADAVVVRMPWVLRFTDFDVLQHVNNAAYWEIVEEVLSSRRDLRAPLRAELEHRSAMERGAVVEVVTAAGHEGEPLHLWVVADGSVAATVRIAPLIPPTAD